jgi:hypothetical protein
MAAYGVEEWDPGLSDYDESARALANRSRSELAAAQAAEMEAARGMYEHAGTVGTLAGTQLRSQQVPGMLAAAQGGGLQARMAVEGAGQVGYGAGLEGVRMAQGDRLAAAEGVMGAAAQRARYEEAQMRALMQRRQAGFAGMDQMRLAQLGEEERLAALGRQYAGAGVDAGVSGLAYLGKNY